MSSSSPSKKTVINGASIDLTRLHTRAVEPTDLRRVFTKKGRELNLTPRSSGRPSRFDDPTVPPGYAVTYASANVIASLFEARAIVQPPYKARLVVRREHHLRGKVARFKGKSALNMLPLTERNVNLLNAVDTVRESDYNGCRALAKALHDALPEVDGLEYVSRMYPPHLCWAIFDRGVERVGLAVDSVTPIFSEPEYREALHAGLLVLAPTEE